MALLGLSSGANQVVFRNTSNSTSQHQDCSASSDDATPPTTTTTNSDENEDFEDLAQMLIQDIHQMATELRHLGEGLGVIPSTEGGNVGDATADSLADGLHSMTTSPHQATSSSRGTMTVPIEEAVLSTVGPQGEPGPDPSESVDIAPLASHGPTSSGGSYHHVDDIG